MSVTGVVLGVLGGISIIASVGTSVYKNKQEEKAAKIAEIDYTISKYNAFIATFEDLKDGLTKSIGKLTDGKNKFKDGGHVQGGIPLANSEINICMSNMYSAIGILNSLIKLYEDEIEKLNQKKSKL